jgi:molybdenum cofactor cytidylyltransferase
MYALQSTAPETVAALILLADQPLVTAEHLRQLRALLSPDCSAVAAEYSGSPGVPAIFQRSAFPALLTLSPESGAKQLLRTLGDRVRRLPMPEAAADIDTPEDYARLTF